MRIEYDKENHALFIKFAEGQYDQSEEVVAGVVVDFDSNGKPLGIEVEDVRGLIDEGAIQRLTEATIDGGADLRRLRDQLGLTQQELAELFDIPRNTIARWERDEIAIEKKRMLSLALRALVGGAVREPRAAAKRSAKPKSIAPPKKATVSGMRRRKVPKAGSRSRAQRRPARRK